MKLNLATYIAAASVVASVSADAVPWERLNKNDSVLLVVDLQVGLYQIVRDFDPTQYHNNLIAHSAIGKLFDIPTILTSSSEQGPNGPLPKEILDMYPDAPLIKRQGEVNAWDNAEFRAALQATGRKQVIIGGITTDVCTTFLALSLRAEGYSVFANVEASGTTTQLIRDVSNSRMQAAGVQLVTLFSIVADLMRDWRATPGAAEVLPWLAHYYPVYGYLARGHGAAVQNGSLIPGEATLLE